MGGAADRRAGQPPGGGGGGARVLSLPPRLTARLEHELARGRGLVALLDFDGTLAPVVPDPAAAALAPIARSALGALAVNPRVRLAVLSGRALADVRARVGLARVAYGGCHGLEIGGGGLAFRHAAARAAPLAAARRLLAAGAVSIPGVRLEPKGLALAVHYRRVRPPRRAAVAALVAGVRRRVPGLAVIPGHRVLDVVPRVRWDKGRAAWWLAARLGAGLGARRPAVLYVGDDTTDEAAFAALRRRGVTVRVGGGPSAAQYAVRGIGEVHALLRWLARAIG